MICFVTPSAMPRPEGLEALTSLPTPPASRWSGFLIDLSSPISLTSVVAWAVAVRGERPFVPIGLLGKVDRDTEGFLSALKALGMPFSPVVSTTREAYAAGVRAALEQLHQASLEGAIVRAWTAEWNVRDKCTLHLLRSIASHGAEGRRAYTMRFREGRGKHLSERSIRRRLHAAGLPALGVLLRDARIRSVTIRIDEGMRRRDAVAAAGWHSVGIYEKAAARGARLKMTG